MLLCRAHRPAAGPARGGPLLLGEPVDQTLTDSPQSADDAADVAFGTCFGRRSQEISSKLRRRNRASLVEERCQLQKESRSCRQRRDRRHLQNLFVHLLSPKWSGRLSRRSRSAAACSTSSAAAVDRLLLKNSGHAILSKGLKRTSVPLAQRRAHCWKNLPPRRNAEASARP